MVLEKSVIAALHQDIRDHFFIPYIVDMLGGNDFPLPHAVKPTNEWFGRRGKPDANPIEKLCEVINSGLRKYYR